MYTQKSIFIFCCLAVGLPSLACQDGRYQRKQLRPYVYSCQDQSYRRKQGLWEVTKAKRMPQQDFAQMSASRESSFSLKPLFLPTVDVPVMQGHQEKTYRHVFIPRLFRGTMPIFLCSMLLMANMAYAAEPIQSECSAPVYNKASMSGLNQIMARLKPCMAMDGHAAIDCASAVAEEGFPMLEQWYVTNEDGANKAFRGFRDGYRETMNREIMNMPNSPARELQTKKLKEGTEYALDVLEVGLRCMHHLRALARPVDLDSKLGFSVCVKEVLGSSNAANIRPGRPAEFYANKLFNTKYCELVGHAQNYAQKVLTAAKKEYSADDKFFASFVNHRDPEAEGKTVMLTLAQLNSDEGIYDLLAEAHARLSHEDFVLFLDACDDKGDNLLINYINRNTGGYVCSIPYELDKLIMTIQKLLTPEEFSQFFNHCNSEGLDAEGYAASIGNGKVASYLLKYWNT